MGQRKEHGEGTSGLAGFEVYFVDQPRCITVLFLRGAGVHLSHKGQMVIMVCRLREWQRELEILPHAQTVSAWRG